MSEPEQTDEQLAAVVARRGESDLAPCAAGDAFDRLYHKYAPLLLAYIATRAWPAEPEELHQEVWRGSGIIFPINSGVPKVSAVGSTRSPATPSWTTRRNTRPRRSSTRRMSRTAGIGVIWIVCSTKSKWLCFGNAWKSCPPRRPRLSVPAGG